jgi:hypothetical protein
VSAADLVLALRVSALDPGLAAVPCRAMHRASELTTRRNGASALARSAPGSAVTFSGVQGGAGVSTATLLACGAVTCVSDRPAVAIDLAAGTRGGLGGLAGTWSQTSAEATAELVIAGGSLARPYTQTRDGVHVISDTPQAAIAIDQTARKLLAATAKAVKRHAADHELADLSRAYVTEATIEEFAGAHPATQWAALHKLVRAARASHSLVAIDLGLADDELLARNAVVSDLHVWVVAARCEDLDVTCQRLLSHEVVADRELVLAWLPDGERVGSRALRRLGDTRGCSVARLARFDRTGPWADRERACRSGLEALCRHLD